MPRTEILDLKNTLNNAPIDTCVWRVFLENKKKKQKKIWNIRWGAYVTRARNIKKACARFFQPPSMRLGYKGEFELTGYESRYREKNPEKKLGTGPRNKQKNYQRRYRWVKRCIPVYWRYTGGLMFHFREITFFTY